MLCYVKQKYCMQVNIVIGWKVKKEKQTFFLADIFICFAYTVCKWKKLEHTISIWMLMNT